MLVTSGLFHRILLLSRWIIAFLTYAAKYRHRIYTLTCAFGFKTKIKMHFHFISDTKNMHTKLASLEVFQTTSRLICKFSHTWSQIRPWSIIKRQWCTPLNFSTSTNYTVHLSDSTRRKIDPNKQNGQSRSRNFFFLRVFDWFVLDNGHRAHTRVTYCNNRQIDLYRNLRVEPKTWS